MEPSDRCLVASYSRDLSKKTGQSCPASNGDARAESISAHVHAGFMLFVALTVLTIYAQPAPLKLGAHKLALLEERVLAAGKAGWQVRLQLDAGECSAF